MKRVTPEFSTFHFFPFLREVFVPGTSRAVQTHFVPSWYKEKWKKWKVENSGATRFLQPAVVGYCFFSLFFFFFLNGCRGKVGCWRRGRREKQDG
jgi:hypothetical protein